MDGETHQQKRRDETRINGPHSLVSTTAEGPTMSAIDDGGPAFPFAEATTDFSVSPGMTLRDWFAGQAMRSMLENPNGSVTPKSEFSEAANECYLMADAMIAARNTLP